jgi:hypothetical protein
VISGSAWGNVSALGGTRTPNLLIRRVTLAFAGFLTCAGFPRFACPALVPRISRDSHWQIHWPLADCRQDAPEPSSRLTHVNG